MLDQLTSKDLFEIIGLIITALSGGGYAVHTHKKIKRSKSDLRELTDDTRERLIKVERDVKNITHAFGEDIREVKDDVRYIRDKLDKLSERK